MIAHTKLSSDRITKRIYPYYAGYSEKFVDSVIKEIGIQKDQIILDPWNGSGTTTASAARHGIQSIGIDLNPFMKAAATFRVAEIELVRSSISKILSVSLNKKRKKYSDALATAKDYFYSAGEANKINDKEFWILIFIIGISLRRASKGYKSKNPAWYKEKGISDVSSLDFKEGLMAVLNDLSSYVSGKGEFQAAFFPKLYVGDLVNIEQVMKINHVITSPPYLTRIDYVKKSLPETYFASEVLGIDCADLRRQMTGSVVTSNISESDLDSLPDDVNDILHNIRSHPSKASDTYYFRFFANYFIDMQRSLDKLDELVAEDGTLTFVTQPSYYKEIFVDLPSLVSSLLARHGWGEKLATEHLARNSIVQVNTRTFASSQGVPAERSVIYRRV